MGACNKHFPHMMPKEATWNRGETMLKQYTGPVVLNASELANTDEGALYLRQMLFLFKGETQSAAV